MARAISTLPLSSKVGKGSEKSLITLVFRMRARSPPWTRWWKLRRDYRWRSCMPLSGT